MRQIAGKLLIYFVLVLLSGCGNNSPSTPISLPAPTGGYITVTTPNAEGNVLVFGTIVVNEQAIPNVTVKVTNLDKEAVGNISKSSMISVKSVYTTTTTDGSGYFSTVIEGSLNDRITVQYQDAVSGVYSDPASFTSEKNAVPMPSSSMIPMDVDIDSNNGLAVIVGNDGISSTIMTVNLETGTFVAAAAFDSVTFDKIAVHSGLNYAAILDTANSVFYWYDISTVEDGMLPSSVVSTPAGPHDVALIEFSTHDPLSLYNAYDMIIIGHDFDTSTWGYMSSFAVGTDASLGAITSTLSINNPSDPLRYAACSAFSTITCAGSSVTHIDLIETVSNRAKLAYIAKFSNGNKVLYYTVPEILLSGPSVYLSPSMDNTYALILNPDYDPYGMAWYDEDTVLATDPDGGLLKRYAEAAENTMTEDSLSVGTGPEGVVSDFANERTFVADFGANTVVDVDMTTFQLSGNTHTAANAPTDLIYYESGSTKKIGVIVTSPVALFRVITAAE